MTEPTERALLSANDVVGPLSDGAAADAIPAERSRNPLSDGAAADAIPAERSRNPLSRALRDCSHDELLVARLLAGDDHALREAWKQFGGYVYGLARRVTCSEEAASEIAQDVFVHLWQHPDRVDLARGGLRSYLGVIAHRRSVDHVRSAERRRRREEAVVAHVDTVLPDVAEAAMAMLQAEAIRAALDDLPDDQRRAVELAYFGGLSFRDVAVALGIPEGTAKSRLRLALAKLSAALGPRPAVERAQA